MSNPRATVEIDGDSTKLASTLHGARASVKNFAGDIGKAMNKSVVMPTAIGNFAGGMMTRAFDMVTDAGRGVVDFERGLTRLGIAGGLSAAKLDEIRKSASAVSDEVGINRKEILDGTTAYVDLTGDIAGATKSMRTFGRVAQASGSSVADISTASAAFVTAGVPLEDMEQLFSGLISQGKAGAVTLKDLAGEAAGLVPQWNKFNEALTSDGIAQFGAVFQVARRGFGSASEAATGMQALMKSLSSNQFAKNSGIDVFEHHKGGRDTLKTFEQIISAIETSKKLNGGITFGKAFDSSEARRTLDVLLEARKTTAGQASDYAKLRDAGMDAGAVQRDLDTYMSSSAGRMEQSFEKLKNKLAEVFTPERIDKFVGALEKAVSLAERVIDAVGKIPKLKSSVDDFLDQRAIDGEAQSRKDAVDFAVDKGAITPQQGELAKSLIDKVAADLQAKSGLRDDNFGMSDADKARLSPTDAKARADALYGNAGFKAPAGGGDTFGIGSFAPVGTSGIDGSRGFRESATKLANAADALTLAVNRGVGVKIAVDPDGSTDARRAPAR